MAFLLWLVLFAPRLLVPPASDASLRDVTDAAKRHELRDSRLKLQNEVRTTLLQGIGGLAVLIGAFFTYRQVQTGRQQLEVAQQGQVTERFTRAIDQLGHENMDVRLGGIYALERIANDSVQDRAAVAEVLTAFVRGHSPWPPSQPGQAPMNAAILAVAPLRVRAADVQAALTVLGRRQAPMDSAQSLDLRVTDLRRADLTGAQLAEVNLFGAQLQEARIFGGNLRAAILAEAQIEGAFLAEVQLQGADLRRARLQQAALSKADLRHANLSSAKLQDADLSSAKLEGATLFAARLERAKLGNAKLQGSDLHAAHLEQASLYLAQLQDADLRYARLQGTNLGAADLRAAILTDAELDGALCNAKTIWPEGFDWEAAGVKLVED
jgi:uncharacterized protein YjbI with pentapeptide repeats